MSDSNFLEKNISILSTKNQNLAKQILNAGTQKSVYTGTMTAKNGMSVVSLANSKPMYSLYNPTPKSQPVDFTRTFYLVGGLGNGYHFLSLLENSENHVLIVEKNADSIKFLFLCYDFSQILSKPNFDICTTDSLEEKLLATYIPQICGIFKYLSNRVWAENCIETEKTINQLIRSSLQKIRADYSVQAHFGKIWLRNIMENLYIFSKQKKNNSITIPNHKTAAIIAAGPTLDSTIKILKNKQDDYYIIATDTASQVLFLNNIKPDAIVSVDGQNISYRHFLKTNIIPHTLYILDLCANASISRAVVKSNGTLRFVSGTHPLCKLASDFFKTKNNTTALPFLDSTSGTVTGAALDYAIKAGFNKIELFGADFAYSYGKPYSRGSYLDETFNNSSSRIGTQETAFSALMFRTPLIPLDNSKTTTETLQQYNRAITIAAEKSYAHIAKISADMKFQNFKTLKNGFNKQDQFDFFTETLYNPSKFADFITWILKSISEARGKPQSDILTVLLPFAAWCEKKGYYQSSKDSFDRILDLAQDFFKRYAE